MKELILTFIAVTAIGSVACCNFEKTPTNNARSICKSSIIMCECENEPVNLNMPGVQYMILR